MFYDFYFYAAAVLWPEILNLSGDIPGTIKGYEIQSNSMIFPCGVVYSVAHFSNIVNSFYSYQNSCVKPLAKRMKDGAALLQFEGSWVFTEVLSDSIAHSL